LPAPGLALRAPPDLLQLSDLSACPWAPARRAPRWGLFSPLGSAIPNGRRNHENLKKAANRNGALEFPFEIAKISMPGDRRRAPVAARYRPSRPSHRAIAIAPSTCHTRATGFQVGITNLILILGVGGDLKIFA
jgi:hypothetical protein